MMTAITMPNSLGRKGQMHLCGGGCQMISKSQPVEQLSKAYENGPLVPGLTFISSPTSEMAQWQHYGAVWPLAA